MSFLTEIRHLGLRVTLADGSEPQISVKPVSGLTDALRLSIRGNRDTILAELRAEANRIAADVSAVDEMRRRADRQQLNPATTPAATALVHLLDTCLSAQGSHGEFYYQLAVNKDEIMSLIKTIKRDENQPVLAGRDLARAASTVFHARAIAMPLITDAEPGKPLSDPDDSMDPRDLFSAAYVAPKPVTVNLAALLGGSSPGGISQPNLAKPAVDMAALLGVKS